MKKHVIIVTIILLFSMLATYSAAADSDTELPTWQVAFDPTPFLGPFEADDTALEFKGRMYFKFWGEQIVDQAWSTADGENWSLAWEATSIQEEFEYFWPMIVHENQVYVVLRDADGLYPDRIMRSPDGLEWEPVLIAEGNENLWVWYGRLMTFTNKLYIFFNYWNGVDYTVRLWRSASGDPGSWGEAGQFHCDMAAFATFKGALFIGSDGCDGGAQIWRSTDGENWEAVTTNGFGDPTNIFTGNFGQIAGYFYVSFASFDAGGDIWRTQDGISWEPVTTDGLGDPNNFVFMFVTYKEKIYAFSGSYLGIQVYRSKDGLDWTPANEPGWGDPGNSIVWRDGAMFVYKGALYVSPAGPAGILKLVEP